MDTDTLLARLDTIRFADPVADLACELLDAGVTEEQLHAMLQSQRNDPLAIELYNKYRDLRNVGWTSSRYGGKRVRWDSDPRTAR